MKQIYITIIAILISINLNAQTFPGTFNYQAVARNDNGEAIANSDIIVEVSILNGNNCGSGSCNLIWQELHYPTTSDYGLFSINIGEGQSTFAGSATDFDSINWNDFSLGSYYLKIRVDFGSSSYINGLIDVGTTKLQSVPYSISSKKANDLVRQNGKVPIKMSELLDIDVSTLSTNEVLSWNGTNWVNTNVSGGGPIALQDLTNVTLSSPTNNQVLYFDGTNWANATPTLAVLGDVTTTGATSGQALTFNGTNWVNTNLSASNLSDVSISSPSSGQALVWDGSNWVNQVVTGSSVWTEDASYVYYNGTKNVGVGTATPVTGFQYVASNDNGFAVTGTYNAAGTAHDFGAGSRMTYFPSKGAFRAGVVDGTQWNDANMGDYSAGFGYNSLASGSYTLVSGRNNTAVGAYSIASGYSNEAQGVASFVTGTTNKAIGLNSLVVGKNNNLGTGLDADNSIVGGIGNDAYSTECFIIGTGNEAHAPNCIVFGENSKTDGTGTGSLSGGSGTNARGNYSVAFGVGCTAGGYASMVLGQYNTIGSYTAGSWVTTEPAIIVGNGTGPTARNNAMIVLKNGDVLIEGTVSQSQVNPSKGVAITNFNDILKLDAISITSNKSTSYQLKTNQIETYFPSLVTDFNNGKAVNYTGFIPIMVETIKSQQTQINDLQTENKLLKKQLNDMDTRLKALEN